MSSKKVIIIDWTHCIEDFLDNIGLTFEEFRTQMNGGWLFGYIQALQMVNTESVFVCFSREIKKRTSFIHEPTGSSIVVLPLPSSYKNIRKRIPNVYTADLAQAAGVFKGIKKSWFSFLLKVAPYCSTPFFLLKKEIKAQQCDALLCQEYENPRFDICVMLGKMLRVPVYASFQGGNWQLSPLEKYFRKTHSLIKSAGLIIATQSEIGRVVEEYDFPKS
jgi:starch synthase